MNGSMRDFRCHGDGERQNINRKQKRMKFTKTILTAALLTGLAAGTLSIRAADKDKK